MIRLCVEQGLSADISVRLNKAQAHYLTHVMRQRAGDGLLLFNGRDGEWQARVETADRKEAALTVTRQTRVMTPGPDLWLAFAPVKRARIDLIAEKATELGVSALCPVFTEFTSVSRVNGERLLANAIEAAEQSRRMDVPSVHEAQKLDELLSGWPSDRRCLYCDETGAGHPINEVLRAFQSDEAVEPWAILIGPEGGFSSRELDRLSQTSNFTPVSLGPRILRAETAALAAITCWQSVLGDWQE